MSATTLPNHPDYDDEAARDLDHALMQAIQDAARLDRRRTVNLLLIELSSHRRAHRRAPDSDEVAR